MTAGPPRLAERVVAWSLREDERAAVLGDLQEEFSALLVSHGPRTARRWYWTQALRSVLPNVTRRRAASRRRPMFASGTLAQDVRFGFRTLRRRPLVTSIAVLSLVAGLSMAAVVFNLLYAIVLKPLPVADPDRLAVLLAHRGTDSLNHNFSYPDFQDYRARQQTFTDLTAYSRAEVTVRLDSESEIFPAELVAGSYFSTLGVGTRFGRGLTDADVTPGAPPAAVVSDAMWRRLTSGATAFASHTITINQQPFAVVGVASPGFGGMIVGRDVRVWLPLIHRDVIDPGPRGPVYAERGMSWLTILGRLKPGIGVDRAAADLDQVERVLGAELRRAETRTFVLEPGAQGDSSLPALVGSPLRLLLGAALLVLVVACGNVASLLVSRTVERTREIAMRTALGASRWRIARMLLVETLIVTMAGAAFGVAVSIWAAQQATRLITQFGEPVAITIGVDWSTFALVAAAAFGTALLSSMAPIVHVLRTPAAAGLGVREGSATPAGARLRSGLVVMQFALSIALVGSAALLVRTIVNLRAVPTGFDLDHVALVGINPAAAQLADAQVLTFTREVERRLSAVPGVRSAAYGRIIPVGFGGSRGSIAVSGYTPAPAEDMEINFNVVSPDYFDATGIATRDGRMFAASDPITGPIPAVVNETMARKFWPDGRAVGRAFSFDGETTGFEVIGVAADVKYRMIREEAGPSFYMPVGRIFRPRGGIIHVRTVGDAAALLPELRRAAASVDPRVPVTDLRTLRDQVSRNLSTDRMAMTIGVSLGGAALVLAAVGLFGAMSNLVGQRRREIGVRLALGARPSEVAGLIVGHGLRLSLVGSALGLGLAFWIGRVIESRLYGVGAFDPLSLGASVIVLAGVAAIATWAPAHRAAQTDPVEALRAE